jgi:hypothetical protein
MGVRNARSNFYASHIIQPYGLTRAGHIKDLAEKF